MLIASFLGWKPGQPPSHYIGNDFAEFYVAGKILNEHAPPALYDLNLQTKLFRELHREGEATLWFACAPHLALAFRPFALFPYRVAYLLWILTATGLYAIGLRTLYPFLAHLRKDQRQAAILLAISFWPFAGWTLHGGQIGVLAFTICACAARLDLDGRRFWAGLALAGLLYKPSLAMLLVPLMLVRWNLRLIAGFAAGALATVATICIFLGSSVLRSYWGVLSMYQHFASSGYSPWENWPLLIDGNHFIRRIVDTHGPFTVILVAAVLMPPFVWLAANWRSYDSSGPDRQRLLWAAALTWTLVINGYATTYDSLIVVAAAFLAASVLYERPGRENTAALFFVLMVLIYIASLVAPMVTDRLRVHFYTLVLAAFGAFALRYAGSRPVASAPPAPAAS